MSRDLDIAALVIAYAVLIHCLSGEWVDTVSRYLKEQINKLMEEK